MSDSYLLCDTFAKDLYREIRGLPIIDYHNHLSLHDIKNNTVFENITKLWIEPDPYKHRLMRILGTDERLITGSRTDRECFDAWCKAFPYLMGTPVYDWSLCELKTVFDADIFPCIENADALWDVLSGRLSSGNYTPDMFFKSFNVEYAAPCAYITDDVSFFETKDNLSPSLRGDDIVWPAAEFVQRLADITQKKIDSLDDYMQAVWKRMGDFKQAGCHFGDHALDDGFVYFEDDGKNGIRFKDMLIGCIEPDEMKKLSCYILTELGVMYQKFGLVMQLHMGALRSASSRLRALATAAGGFAGIGTVDIASVTKFLDAVEKKASSLPRTILFTLNPSYNAAVSVLCGSYSDGKTAGLVTQGPAWWWCDHIHGIKEVLDSFSVYGVIYRFPGMTTDSRSFLSLVRHDYFRRLLCSWISQKVKTGELPCRYNSLRELAERISYKNAREMIVNEI